MAYEKLRGPSLDYTPCRYGASKLLFRGPKRPMTGDFAAFLGGTETYGKFIPCPFPDRVEAQTGLTCVNFGCPNAGVDVFLNDPAIQESCRRACLTVLQVPCAQNMTNRFYSVHPRRNDRFIAPSVLMRQLFRETDFTQFHFTRHMVQHLQQEGPERFGMLRTEIQTAWVARMRKLIDLIGGPVVLLWFSTRSPEGDAETLAKGAEPAFVTRPMLGALDSGNASLLEVRISAAAREAGTQGMVFPETEIVAAEKLPGPLAHEEAACALSPVVTGVLGA